MAVEAKDDADDKLDNLKVPFPPPLPISPTPLFLFSPTLFRSPHQLPPQMCIEDNRCFLASLCLEQQWSPALQLLRQGWSAGSVRAQFKAISTSFSPHTVLVA
jgi:hypothetical protein